MKSDLNILMAERGLEAIIVMAGGHGFCAELEYLTGGVAITGGIVVKKLDSAPIILANSMETEEAGATGLTVYTQHQLGYEALLEQADGNRSRAELLVWGAMLKTAGVESGKVGIYGNAQVNHIIEFIPALREALPEYEFVGERGITIFDKAYITKDADELKRIFSVAERTNEVVKATRDYISRHRADEDEQVVKADGSPLTIGDVKRFVRVQLIERGLEEEHMIFAQGRDAGFPHSRGNESDVLRLGQSIVFDLFPREIGGGYYHDMTRTWCIGYAPDDVRLAYNQVMEAFDISLEMFGLNKPTHLAQEAVLDYFENLGHQTSRSHPGTQQGYVHSLGHGLGLNIHENPRMSHVSKDDIFQLGNAVTIEPGLYYPEKGYGIRVEDTFYVNQDGQLISLTDTSKDLIVPLRGA